MRLAGLSSDQSRITREPQFTSKRKGQYYPPQVSSSFHWKGHVSSPQLQEKSRPVTPPAVTPVLRASSAEREETPLAPRDPVPPEGTTTPSHQLQADAQAAQTSTSAADQQRLNGINHALRKKAGLRSEQQRNGRLSSEYQRQFMWKTPVADSPLLAAHEMLYSNNRAIPPFKSNPVIFESEYKRSFKGSPPPRPPRLRRDVEQYEVPLLHTENTTQEKRKRKKKKERQHSRKSSPEEEVTYLQKQEMRSPCAPRDPSPKAIRKVKTEYRSNFRSPIQYSYRDKAWVKVRPAKEEECDDFHEWYHEVQELREKAEAYRKRAWGTHFSRQHLNQILSDHNWMWEPSNGSSSSSIESEACRSTSSSPIIEALDLARAGSTRASSSPGPSASVAASRRSSLGEEPTLPVQRKLAWDEEEGHGERNESEISQEEFTVKKNQWYPKDDHGNIKERNDRLQLLETESSLMVDGSEDAGRLPTPKLKTMQTVQRTHHDRTTPATGGALLVSPPKIKHSSRKVKRSEPPLGKSHSPYKHIIDGSPQQPHSKAENGSLPRSPPAAGLITVDLLPMREDAWPEDKEAKATDYTPHPRQPKPTQKQQTSHCHKAAVSPLPNRIQGTMRNQEFQHNGNLGIFRPDPEFPESVSSMSENDDKMSQISSRSAASCSMASEILGRAQRRKEEFWGKH
ncbi:nuclear protein MDM1 isoform X4 [Pimephales promelas]|nr:nuclear protein MDM1 isoform X4 [Pimephales promelas]XP_039524092.1 nuclear protein MDM1 isoform X4 [Pimephales promelas]XP_039524093.1 nuclear protein MDM1 isoform X4 [Pimephales promelas]